MKLDTHHKLEKDIEALAAKVRQLVKEGVPRKLVVNVGPGRIQEVYVEKREYVKR